MGAFHAIFAGLGLASALAASAQQLAAQGHTPRRNIVLILSDDHRHDFLGSHPSAPKWLETPALDRMARGGAHLRSAFVTTSLCSPSRASILTGRYAHRHGVVDNTSPLPPGTGLLPPVAPAGRLPDCLRRQVAHGRGRRGRE